MFFDLEPKPRKLKPASLKARIARSIRKILVYNALLNLISDEPKTKESWEDTQLSESGSVLGNKYCRWHYQNLDKGE